MDKDPIKALIESEKIIRNNHIPTPPSPGGFWVDKDRDHDSFQEIVSLAAQLGGVNASAGCLTKAAKAARSEAEQQYYDSQKIRRKKL